MKLTVSNARHAMTKTLVISMTLFLGSQLPAYGGAKDVNVTNTPSVNVNNSDLPVTVQNDLGNPVPVRSSDSDRIPYQVEISDFVFNPTAKSLDFTVPAGTDRFVIEYVSAVFVASASSIGVNNLSITTTANGATASHHLVVGERREDTDTGDLYIISQGLRLYADPDTLVHLGVSVLPVGTNVAGTMTLSGYLLSVDDQRLAP